jgi:hypothetical protein
MRLEGLNKTKKEFNETNPLVGQCFNKLCYRVVLKPNDSECYTPSSEPFRFYLLLNIFYSAELGCKIISLLQHKQLRKLAIGN